MIGDRKPETKFADRQGIDPDFTIARLGVCRRTAWNIFPATSGSPKAFVGPGLPPSRERSPSPGLKPGAGVPAGFVFSRKVR
ncbi:hypothetical protein [Syntrophobacter fumaroxidans]|uniref:Uncharacterized protein n=1 Tax=Syntrophobacter fumaroxidans (strain DSM 10017 / MPOB) TaxID=335543 RepID=A0LIA3_SYNFM|nr:hypothetical protein [Syntrophobacter fumaroxidans]ABK17155.1 hypothetical protein Sfum_1466 [Syntrophobacter fumaroxidans MPOB]